MLEVTSLLAMIEPSPLEMRTRGPTYHSYQGPNSLVTELQRLASEFPEITQLSSIGQTHQGRELWALKISDNVADDEDEPEVLMDGGFPRRRMDRE